MLDAGGDRHGDAARASDKLQRTIGELLTHAQRAGTVREDVKLPEVYALLAGTARAAVRAHLDPEARARLLAVIIDGLAPRPGTRS
jgi:hypothetical protein